MVNTDTFGEYIFKVRSYECGRDGRATLPTICNYLQEAASLNAEELGFSKSDFAAAGSDISWVLTKMRVKMTRYPRWEEVVKVLTFPRGGRRIVAWRDFTITDNAGETLGVASTEWMVIDLASRKVAAIPEAVFVAANTVREPVFGLEPFTRFKFPKAEDAEVEPPMKFIAQNSHIDLNGHVNNVHYIEWMLEPIFIGKVKAASIVEMEIVFRSETFAGEEVLVSMAEGTLDERYHRVYAANGGDHAIALTRYGE